MSRVKAVWHTTGADMEVQVSAKMTATTGVVAASGVLIWRAGSEELLPTTNDHVGGDLEFDEQNEIPEDNVTQWFYDCRIVNLDPRKSQTLDYEYTIKDRRWRWQFTKPLFGEYNVRDKDGEIVLITRKSAREIVQIILDEMGEVDYDVSILPNTIASAAVIPHVDWHYANCATELQKVLRGIGMDVVLQLTTGNPVKIIQDGIGTVPDDVRLSNITPIGTTIELAPQNIVAYANETLFDSWLYMEAIGLELDGTVKPIELLSYRPSMGWALDPYDMNATLLRSQMTGTDEAKEKKVELIQRYVFRAYRPIAFLPGQTSPQGLDLTYENTSAVYEVIDGSGTVLFSGDWLEAVVVAGQEPEGRLVGPGETVTYTGYTNPSAESWQIVDKTYNGDGLYGSSYPSREAAEDARRAITPGIPSDYVIVPPGYTVFDPRAVLPLEPTRLVYGLTLENENERIAPEVMGDFTHDPRMHGRGFIPKKDAKKYLWDVPFRIDTKKGFVLLSRPAYKMKIDETEASESNRSGIVQPMMFVRTGYRVRDSPYGSYYHRRYVLSTGITGGGVMSVVDRRDIQEHRIQVYTNDYDTPELGTGITNTTEVDDVLLNAATEDLKQYENLTGPHTRTYAPIRSIECDGLVKQVQYMCGLSTIGQTIVSVGQEDDLSLPTAVQSRRNELQKEFSTSGIKGDVNKGFVLAKIKNGNAEVG